MNIIKAISLQEQINNIINYLSTKINNLLLRQEQIVLAVSGGKSPIELFKSLSQVNLPWDKITITLVDERFIAKTHEDSNEKLVKDYLLQNQAKNAKFVSLIKNQSSIEQSLFSINQTITKIDIAILGMGDDGHTASIFPDCPELADAVSLSQKNKYIITTPLKAKYLRIGLNLNFILSISELILTINGNSKLNLLNSSQSSSLVISQIIQKRPEMPIFSYV